MKIMLIESFTCFKWFFKIVPSGSGKGGISLGEVSLLESRSTSQISSGNLKINLLDKKI